MAPRGGRRPTARRLDDHVRRPCRTRRSSRPWQDRRVIDGREVWDTHAATFDDEGEHGLRDPAVRAAWAGLLAAALPAAPASVADLGCGTGSVAVLLAEAGHRVYGLDTSPGMLGMAREKAVL